MTEPPGLIIVVCTKGVVRAEWASVLACQAPPMGLRRNLSLLEGFTDVPLVRNVALNAALDEGVRYLMFWDDDVIPRSKVAIRTMVAAMDQNPEATAIGGVYPRRSELPEPIVSLREGDGVWWGWEAGGLHPVYMTGTGFLILRMADLASIEVPVIRAKNALLKQFFSQEGSTDDFYFADLLKASEKLWFVHGDLICDQVDLDGRRYAIEGARQKVMA